MAQKRSLSLLKNKKVIKKKKGKQEERRKKKKARMNEIVVAITKKKSVHLSHCRILSVYSRCEFQVFVIATWI